MKQKEFVRKSRQYQKELKKFIQLNFGKNADILAKMRFHLIAQFVNPGWLMNFCLGSLIRLKMLKIA